MSLSDDVFKEVVAGQIGPGRPDKIGVAVSGGSDSLALMLILNAWAQDHGAVVFAVSVDHCLRPEARAEAEYAGQIAAQYGISHDILTWDRQTDGTALPTGTARANQGKSQADGRDGQTPGVDPKIAPDGDDRPSDRPAQPTHDGRAAMPWNGQGNLPDQARRARYDLMAAWGQSKGIDLIALGHTADDQAETFLMRLARSSGADGLAAMATRRRHGAVTYLRPVLGLRRADLRAFLTRRDVVWMEDPSNADPKYTRTQAREALRVLAPLGIDVPTLTTVADNLSSIRKALNWYSFTEARNHVCIDQSDVVIDLAAYRTLPAEIARRILQFACLWITGAEYTPRRNGMALLAEALKSGRGMTLAGTHASVARGEIRITRELAATASAIPVTAPDVPVIWDHRWRVQGPAPHRSCQPMIPEKPSVALNDARKMGAAPKQKADQSDAQLTIAAIGKDGLAQCPQWRETGVPRLSLLAAPAVWRGSDLVAAPLAGYPNGWSANLCRGEEDFFTSILTH